MSKKTAKQVVQTERLQQKLDRGDDKNATLLGCIVSQSMRNVVIQDTDFEPLCDKYKLKKPVISWVAAYNRAARRLIAMYADNDADIDILELPETDGNGRAIWQIDVSKEAAVESGIVGKRREYEVALKIDYETGDCVSHNNRDPDMAERLAAMAAEEKHILRTGHVSRSIDAIFKSVDLVPLRDQGGVYFVFAENMNAVETAEDFMVEVGGIIGRNLGSITTEDSDFRFSRLDIWNSSVNRLGVQQSWTSYIADMVQEYQEAVDEFDPSSMRVQRLEKLAEKIRALRVKIDAHSAIMVSTADDTKRDIATLNATLAKKIKAAQAAKAAKAKPKP